MCSLFTDIKLLVLKQLLALLLALASLMWLLIIDLSMC